METSANFFQKILLRGSGSNNVPPITTSTPNKAEERAKSRADEVYQRRNIEEMEDSENSVPEIQALESMANDRKKALDKYVDDIGQIKDESIKKIMLGLTHEMLKLVEDNQTVNVKMNEVIVKQNEVAEEQSAIFDSINNLNQATGSVGDKLESFESRLQSVETKQGCQYDSQFLHILMVDNKEAEEVERGTIWPSKKCALVLDGMQIRYNKAEIGEVSVQTERRKVGTTFKMMKYLKIRFNNHTSAGKIFGQIVRWNNERRKQGEQDRVKYIAEHTVCRNVWKLKRICLELKKEGVIQNVHVNDDGLVCIYKMGDENKRFKVSSQRDIDALRRVLKVADHHVPVAEKYGPEFWKARYVASSQKRGRESEGEENEGEKRNKTCRDDNA
jgi:hypothetical protein